MNQVFVFCPSFSTTKTVSNQENQNLVKLEILKGTLDYSEGLRGIYISETHHNSYKTVFALAIATQKETKVTGDEGISETKSKQIGL